MSEEDGDSVRVEIRDLDEDLYDRMVEAVDFFDDSRNHSKKHYALRTIMAGVFFLESRRASVESTREMIDSTNGIMYDEYDSEGWAVSQDNQD